MPLTLKLSLAAALIIGTTVLWRVTHLQKMLRHTQECMYFGRPDNLMYPTKAAAGKAFLKSQKNRRPIVRFGRGVCS